MVIGEERLSFTQFLFCLHEFCKAPSFVFISPADLEELLLSLKQVRGCLTDQQSQNDIELVLNLLHKVI